MQMSDKEHYVNYRDLHANLPQAIPYTQGRPAVTETDTTTRTKRKILPGLKLEPTFRSLSSCFHGAATRSGERGGSELQRLLRRLATGARNRPLAQAGKRWRGGAVPHQARPHFGRGDSGSLWIVRKGTQLFALGLHRGLARAKGSRLAFVSDLAAICALAGVTAIAGRPDEIVTGS